MTDDHNRCEWVNVSSGTSSPRLSWKKSREPSNGLCVCVCVCCVQLMSVMSHYRRLLSIMSQSAAETWQRFDTWLAWYLACCVKLRMLFDVRVFSALMLLSRRQEGHLASKN